MDGGHVYVVNINLEKFFDSVYQSKLIEILSRTIKDGRVISLIQSSEMDADQMANCRKGTWRAAIMLNSVFTKKEIASLGFPSMAGYFLQLCEN